MMLRPPIFIILAVSWNGLPASRPKARHSLSAFSASDPFGPALDATLANETIAGKNLAAKRITTPQEAGNCQILFLSSAEDGRLSKIIEALDKGAVLTVSDMPQFSQRGGMIQFVLEGKKVRFEVNLTAVQRAGLTLSSELLKVATAVRTNPLPGD